MPTPSQKLGLALPAQTDPFSTADIRANWEKIDASPGTYICTSGTRPTWTAAQAGRRIYETDTRLEWVWVGNAWHRMSGGRGILLRTDGTPAIGERTTDYSTTSNTYVRAVSVTGVVVPPGNRPLRVDVSWNRARNPQGEFKGAIFRSNTNNSGPALAWWYFGTTGSDANAGGGAFWAVERGGLAPGNYDFSLQITAPNGTSTLDATTTTPITIMVTEL